ncbi:hypothetical protein JCM10212_003954 [Sporobolomyces blumeae]
MRPLAGSSSRPTFGRAANKFLSNGCFGPNGEVWCFCNTVPRVEALRRVTRKESSPNLGREFYSCGNWQEPKCEMFLWVDESASKGRQNATPPPPADEPAPRLKPTTPAPPSPSKRRRPSSPPRAVAPSSSKRPVPVSERLDDIDFDALLDGLSDEDEIEDASNDESESPRSRLDSSPTRKSTFTSFAGHPSAPTTPKRGQANRIGYDAIKNDPDSPFHSIRRNLFGGDDPGTTPVAPSSSSTAAETQSQSQSQAASSPIKPNSHDQGSQDPLSILSSTLSDLSSLVASIQKDRERDARLIEVGKRKEEMWRGKADKASEEMGEVKRENQILRDKVLRLEHEIAELRLRR